MRAGKISEPRARQRVRNGPTCGYAPHDNPPRAGTKAALQPHRDNAHGAANPTKSEALHNLTLIALPGFFQPSSYIQSESWPLVISLSSDMVVAHA